MEAIIPISSPVAKMTAKTSPWKGWEVRFFDDVSATRINNCKALIEDYFNDYLQRKVNVAANKLIVPFRCRLVLTGGNGKLFKFEVKVFRKLWILTLPFSYPAGPILALNNNTIEVRYDSGTESPAVSISLRPPQP